jgi:hypothetical protein
MQLADGQIVEVLQQQFFGGVLARPELLLLLRTERVLRDPRMIEVLSRSIRIGNKQRTHEQLTIRSRSKSKPQDNALHQQGNGSVSDSLHCESMPPVLELN